MSQNDPDPHLPPEEQSAPQLGGRRAPDGDDPTAGGRDGELGEAPSIAADQPDDAGPGYPVGGGTVTEETDAPPVSDPEPGG